MKIQLSVAIITYNEEKNIRRCLESVKNIADEIIVVDSFSTDKTEAICKEFNVQFTKNKFIGHIQQKNYTLEQTKYNYVLSLDADEVLSNELRKSILKVKNNWKNDAYSFNRLTNFCGKWIKHCNWYPDQKIRLIDKRKGRWGGQNPHDKIIIEKKSVVKHIKGDLLHYSFYTIEQHIRQINKFSEISAKALFEKGKKSNLLKILISPVIKFIKSYFIKLGFLDGFSGFVVCVNSAYATYLKYVKLKKNFE